MESENDQEIKADKKKTGGLSVVALMRARAVEAEAGAGLLLLPCPVLGLFSRSYRCSS